MGTVSLKIGDGTARFRRSTLCSSLLHLLMLSSVLATNLFAFYAFSSSSSSSNPTTATSTTTNISTLLSKHITSILKEIQISQLKLHQIEREISGYSSLDPSSPNLAPELSLFLSRHPLPLGKDSRSGITQMVASIGHSCIKSNDLLTQFMSYKPFSYCPLSDSHLPKKLISRACEPLPRRRCLTKVKPRSNPKWAGPKSSSWVKSKGKNDFLADDVLGLASNVKVGLDFGSSADGEFAAVMAERNVTVMTASYVNEEEILNKGVFALSLSGGVRFPFYDNVFDLVHTGKGLDEGGMGVEAMEFLMFDLDRVLRANGLFWLDNYLCVDDERKRMVTRLIEKFGYKKVKWVVGEKADSSGKGKGGIYLSAVLQKPARG